MKIDVSEKFKPLYELPKEVHTYILTGGRNSQKSFAASLASVFASTSHNHRVLYSRYTNMSLKDSIYAEVEEKVDMLDWHGLFELERDRIIPKSTINKKTKGKIVFKGLKAGSKQQTANLKGLKDFSMWILDEAEELVDEDIYNKISLSIRGNTPGNEQRNIKVLILNPSSKEHFVHKRYFENAGVEDGWNGIKNGVCYIHTTYKDCLKFTPQESIDTFEYIKRTNPSKYNHIVLGGWLDKAEGVVITNWKYGEFNPDKLQTSYGQDFGFSIDPTTLVEVAIDKKKKKIYVKECCYKTKLTTTDIAQINLFHAKKNLIIADSAEPRLINELKSKGCNIRGAEKKKGSIESGIALMQDYEIIVEPNSINIGKEFNNYVYADKGSKLYVDDFNHCFIGSTKIRTDKGLKRIDAIKVNDVVLTSKGYRKVLKTFDNGFKQVYEYSMQFDTFEHNVICTKDHKFKTNNGWQKISNIKPKESLYLYRPLMEKTINFIKVKDTLVEELKDCTQRFGSITTVKYQKTTTYTILIMIQQITTLIILLLFTKLCILGLRVKKGLKIIQSGLKNFMQKVLNLRKNGTNQKRAENGIVNTVKKHGLIDLIKQRYVKSVAKNTKQDTQVFLNTAITTAKLRQIDVKEKGVQKVYDIMVEDCHEYIADNFLVHNCIDAIRYNVTYHLSNPNKGNYDIR